ncbi:hypothetical protein [Mycobacteroides salmoniphilum]|nr:hypothetical protein [Mycobacteroides salmoniphilum]
MRIVWIAPAPQYTPSCKPGRVQLTTERVPETFVPQAAIKAWGLLGLSS